MSHHNRILAYLKQAGIEFQRIEHKATDSLQQAALQNKLPPEQVARAILLGDAQGTLLAVLPLSHIINFAQLFHLAGRKLEPIDRDSAGYIFTGCEAGIIPPLAAPFELPALIDETLLAQDTIYMEAGSHTLLVKLRGEDFQRLHQDSTRGHFSTPVTQLQANDNAFVNRDHYARMHGIRQLRPIEGIKERLNQLKSLPAMHPVTEQLLKIQHDPDAGIQELAAIIETDPGISAQILRNARSAYYNFSGEIETVFEAISLVLGFDTAINVALGISTMHAFELPKEGPLGLQRLWQDALHCAVLSQRLSTLLPRHLGVKPGQAYLAGLLHNFGFFALGHMLKPEYFLLNQVVAANPSIPITLLEKRTLGVGHTQIGNWLMQAWKMPAFLQTTLREHHNETYHGPDALYPNLIMLSDSLLKPHGLGDAADEVPPAAILNALGLTLEQAHEAIAAHLETAQQLDELASAITRPRP